MLLDEKKINLISIIGGGEGGFGQKKMDVFNHFLFEGFPNPVV